MRIGAMSDDQAVCQPAILALPAGFERTEYAHGVGPISGLEMRDDGTLIITRGDPRDRYEITPPHDDEPISIRRVAAELSPRITAATQAAETRAGGFVRFEWHPDSGELTWTQTEPARAAGRDVSLSPATLRLARTLSMQPFTNVRLAPDGALFVADTHAGVIYRVSRAH